MPDGEESPTDEHSVPSPPPAPFAAAPRARQPDNGKATAALVLGIAGLALWASSLGLLFFLNFPCSILAWRFGVEGRRRVLAGETAAGEGPAKAGVALGIMGVVLGILGLLWWVWFALSIG